MSNTTTIARPYAKAIFEHALSEKKLSQWSEILQELAVAILDVEAKQFFANPAVTAEQQVQLLKSLLPQAKIDDSVSNLIELLVQNKRLMLLPEINVIFEALRAEQEKTLLVEIISFSELTAAQQAKLASSLSARLQRQVTLNLRIDKSLLGGAVIHAGDLVIDGSVRGKLDKLRAGLAA